MHANAQGSAGLVGRTPDSGRSDKVKSAQAAAGRRCDSFDHFAGDLLDFLVRQRPVFGLQADADGDGLLSFRHPLSLINVKDTDLIDQFLSALRTALIMSAAATFWSTRKAKSRSTA